MSTFKALIRPEQQKKDGTWNVKIRITHKREIKFIDTPIFVVKPQLNKKLEIKDDLVQDSINEILKNFRAEVTSLGLKVFSMTASELKAHLEHKFEKSSRLQDQEINFIIFARDHIKKIKSEGRDSSAMTYNAVINSIVDYFDTEEVDISKINYKFLISWEKYLKSERKMVRRDQFGKEREIVKPPSTESGVHHYMKDLRTMFNLAIAEFNDEDAGIIKIKHYPFRKYKIGNAPKTRKRNLNREEIQDIIALKLDNQGGLLEMGRDIGLLCFYLIGMNTTDIYHIDNFVDGRISYNRKKTRGERGDDAYISIKVEPEAEVILKKYIDESGERVFNFHSRYANERNFLKGVNEGLRQVAEMAKLEKRPTSVYFRHTWATIARNKCGIDKDIIGKALNHVDSIGTITDVYIETDWSIIDDANRKVLDYIKK